jgi:hypothetical protein
MRNWSQLAEALGLEFTPEWAARVAGPLEQLDAVFGPLAAAVPLETEPAYVSLCFPWEEAQ